MRGIKAKCPSPWSFVVRQRHAAPTLLLANCVVFRCFKKMSYLLGYTGSSLSVGFLWLQMGVLSVAARGLLLAVGSCCRAQPLGAGPQWLWCKGLAAPGGRASPEQGASPHPSQVTLNHLGDCHQLKSTSFATLASYSLCLSSFICKMGR